MNSGCCIIRRKTTHALRGENAEFSQRGQQLETEKRNGMETHYLLSDFTFCIYWISPMASRAFHCLWETPLFLASIPGHLINIRVPTSPCLVSHPEISPAGHCFVPLRSHHMFLAITRSSGPSLNHHLQ